MGIVNFNRSSLPKFALIAAPLDKLRKAKSITWNATLQAAFDGIKALATTSASLVTEKRGYAILIGTDASNEGFGFWRGQPKAEFKHKEPASLAMHEIEIIEYGSIAVPASRNATSTGRELAAVIWTLKKVLKHIKGRRFTLFTDHAALVYLLTLKKPSPLLTRWIDLLMTLDFETVHWRGEANEVADGLSRTTSVSVNEILINTPAEANLMRDKEDPLDQKLRDVEINKAHELGHFGEQQVYLKLWHQGLWWPKIREDIKRITGECVPCLRHNVVQKGYHPLHPIMATLPWSHLSIDLVFPGAKSKKGHSAILVVVCIATKFALAVALKDKSAKVVARKLWKMFTHYGFPKIIQSDNGKEFVNDILSELAGAAGINLRTISAYHPRANGAVERVNKDLKLILKKCLEGNLPNWPTILPWAQFVYNTHITARTASTPFALMFGRQATSLKDYQLEVKEGLAPFRAEDWIKHLTILNNVVYPTIRRRVEAKMVDAVESFDKKHKIVDQFPLGSFVMARDVTQGSKWNAAYEGPYEVSRWSKPEGSKAALGAYYLKDRTGSELPFRFPPSQLKAAPFVKIAKEQSYEVIKIMEKRVVEGQVEYLLEWKDRSINPTWVPADHLDSVTLVERFIKSQIKLKRKKPEHSTEHDGSTPGLTKVFPKRIRVIMKHPDESAPRPGGNVMIPHP